MKRNKLLKNMDESQNHYVGWRKPDTEECIWYDSIYKKFQEIQNYSDRLVVARGWEEKEGTDFKGAQEYFGVTEMFYISIAEGVTQLHTFVKTHDILYLKLRNFYFYKLYLNKDYFLKTTGFFLYHLQDSPWGQQWRRSLITPRWEKWQLGEFNQEEESALSTLIIKNFKSERSSNILYIWKSLLFFSSKIYMGYSICPVKITYQRSIKGVT